MIVPQLLHPPCIGEQEMSSTLWAKMCTCIFVHCASVYLYTVVVVVVAIGSFQRNKVVDSSTTVQVLHLCTEMPNYLPSFGCFIFQITLIDVC